jgi:BMFP domain-containing protein YqiC
MSMSLKKKVKDLEARVEALEEKDSSANDSEE